MVAVLVCGSTTWRLACGVTRSTFSATAGPAITATPATTITAKLRLPIPRLPRFFPCSPASVLLDAPVDRRAGTQHTADRIAPGMRLFVLPGRHRRHDLPQPRVQGLEGLV